MLRAAYVTLVLFLCIVEATNYFKTLEIEERMKQYTYNETYGLRDRDKAVLFLDQENVLIIKCNKSSIDDDIFMPFKEQISPEFVSFEECILPEKPIARILAELNVNTTSVLKLRLAIPDIKYTTAINYTIGIDLDTLWLDIGTLTTNIYDVSRAPYLYKKIENLDISKNLKTLIVDKLSVPGLSKETRLEVLSLRFMAKLGSWEGFCDNLKELSILYLTGIPKRPERCSQLQALKVNNFGWDVPRGVDAINDFYASGISATCTKLQILVMQFCRIFTLPYNLMVSQELHHLDLAWNNLNDTELTKFPLMPNLEHLEFQYNDFTGWALRDMVKQVPGLRYLSFNNNQFVYLYCNYESNLKPLTLLKSLEKLTLTNNLINVECFKDMRFAKLQHLDLRYTARRLGDSDTRLAQAFNIQKLPETNAIRLEVDLRGRPFKYVVFQGAYYDYMAGEWAASTFFPSEKVIAYKMNYTVWLSPIECDCFHYWLARTLIEFPNFVKLPELRCKNTGRELIDEPLIKLDCKSETRDNCTVRSTGVDGSSHRFIQVPNKTETVECHNAIEENSRYPINDYPSDFNTVSLNASNNHIYDLRKIKFPKGMKWVDLRQNRISRLDSEDTTRLFSLPERRVWLSQNIFICDCLNAQMIDTFHEHRGQIVDFEEITCIENGTPLYSVTSYEVCQYGLRAALASAGTVAALLLIATVILWRYRTQVKIYLYSRGWCLRCFSEQDDSEKPYDVFLSFSHADLDYVTEELMPKLEGEPHCFRVCVHYRDWVLGDWIPAQILRSVSLSKRTLIVLSRSFVNSLWGSLEFRYAAASATKVEGLSLLVLVLDDVLTDKLDSELQGYISCNTYLRCDDPWFWQKLLYALPRRKTSSTPISDPMYPSMITTDINAPIVENELTINPRTREVSWIPLAIQVDRQTE